MSDESGDESDENTNFLGTYEGERNDLGERHGDGKAILPNKDTYSGHYSGGVREGLGVYQVMKKGKILATYEGEWCLGKRSGYGICKYEDGSEYKGFWDLDERNGRGTIKFGNGQEYRGSWKSGLREDSIGLLNFTGGLYIGGWKAGVMEGPGVIVYKSPATAICLSSTWQDGKPQGLGIVIRESYFLSGNFLPDGTWRTSSHHPIAVVEQALSEPQFLQIAKVLRPLIQVDETGFALKIESFLEEPEPDLWTCTSISEIASFYLVGKTWKAEVSRKKQIENNCINSPTSPEVPQD
ncbi:Hypothetical predicted protein [Cloeon dipterum]|uniref:MORN repeat-containing protein 5 n=1 Tax=Cloeon dipterum TaxID=197152 RepID=A0A8S1CQE0_9INSE|nr:Hypothetical predicted protein [Cloeon dipterum]